ncbi:MAG TPA: hypothetical protein VGI39_08180, partial [Polyangiaceae bacterium]
MGLSRSLIAMLSVAPVMLSAGWAQAQGMTESEIIAAQKTRTSEAMCPEEGRGAHQRRCFGRRLISNEAGQILPNAGPISGSLGAPDFISAYNIPSTSKSNGAIVAIVDAYGYPNAYKDMSTYRTQYNIPTLPKCSGMPKAGTAPCFAQVGSTGGAPPSQTDSGWEGETALDIEMVSALCPDCNILLVEGADPNNDSLVAALTEAATL